MLGSIRKASLQIVLAGGADALGIARLVWSVACLGALHESARCLVEVGLVEGVEGAEPGEVVWVVVWVWSLNHGPEGSDRG